MAKYYIGMDLASESVRYCVMNGRGKKLAQGSLSWSRKVWAEFVKEWGAEDMIVAFESGPEAYPAEERLMKLKVQTYPFHAANFPAIWRSPKKTDGVDAEKICNALRSNALPERVELADEELARLRNLVTERELHLKMLNQVVGRLRGLARQRGVKLPRYDRKTASDWWPKALSKFKSKDQAMVQRLYRSALTVLQNLEEAEAALEEGVEEAGLSGTAQRIDTAPGIGTVISNSVATYLGREDRFGSARKYASYVGLVPKVSATGKQTTRLGHISKRGPSALRRLYTQAAHAAVSSREFKESPLYFWFERKRKARGRKIAIVALARRLAMISYAMFRDGTTWKPSQTRSQPV